VEKKGVSIKKTCP